MSEVFINLCPGVYSAFVLKDDGTWVQPSFRLFEPASEAYVARALLGHYGGGYFHVACIEPDEACPEEDLVRIQTLKGE